LSRWWILPLLTIIGFIGGFLAWTISQRAIVEYSLIDFADTCTLDQGLALHCEIRNTGNSYVKVTLSLTVENANIPSYSSEIGNTCNGTILSMTYDLPSHMEGYNTQHVNINPIGEPQNFTIHLSLVNRADWSFPDGWIGQWLDPHPYAVDLTYNRTQANTYQRLP